MWELWANLFVLVLWKLIGSFWPAWRQFHFLDLRLWEAPPLWAILDVPQSQEDVARFDREFNAFVAEVEADWRPATVYLRYPDGEVEAHYSITHKRTMVVRLGNWKKEFRI